MALRIRPSIVIDRPIEQVWQYLTDATHDPEWRRPYLKEVRWMGPLATGTRAEGVDNMGRYVMEITRCEPPVRLTWREISERSMQQREGNYILAREGGGTRMTLDITYNTIGLKGRLMPPLLSVIGPRLARRLLNQLKQGVEGQRPS
jgi:uncharacterized protein YndB with AHSA1/START domain